MGKDRADNRVVALGLADSRAKAQALILAGSVLDSNGHPVKKPGQQLESDAELILKGESLPFVSRGGLKLDAALEHFSIDVQDRICLDVGASTGGFTDCLLQRGAKTVYALDVGYNQLAWSLRTDPRVVVHEKVNIRSATREIVPDPVQLIVVDVSFISLRLVLPPALELAAEQCSIVALIKPQFEVGKEGVGKGGIVRDEALREDVVAKLEAFLPDIGLEHRGTIPSPITGAKGNREFLLYGCR
ncbi:MAG: TlyA family RNA methyltransferase [Myxococcota bacterium]